MVVTSMSWSPPLQLPLYSCAVKSLYSCPIKSFKFLYSCCIFWFYLRLCLIFVPLKVVLMFTHPRNIPCWIHPAIGLKHLLLNPSIRLQRHKIQVVQIGSFRKLCSIPHCVSCAGQEDAVIHLCFASLIFLWLSNWFVLLLCGLLVYILNCTYIFRGTLDFKKVRNSHFVGLTLIVQIYSYMLHRCSFFYFFFGNVWIFLLTAPASHWMGCPKNCLQTIKVILDLKRSKRVACKCFMQ